MTVVVPIPGRAELQLEHLLVDVNGTLTNRGALMDGVQERVAALRDDLSIHLVSADTFGTLDQIAQHLRVTGVRAASGEAKLRELDQLGREACVVIGNGVNDALVLDAAALGVAVLGPEGASAAALRAADVICNSAAEALDLLREPIALSATLRP
jgi:soluble P-type ATPase